MLNDCKTPNKWETLPMTLRVPREKFAVAYAAPGFITDENCL